MLERVKKKYFQQTRNWLDSKNENKTEYRIVLEEWKQPNEMKRHLITDQEQTIQNLHTTRISKETWLWKAILRTTGSKKETRRNGQEQDVAACGGGKKLIVWEKSRYNNNK